MKTKSAKLNTLALSIMFVLICFCLCGCAQVNFVTYHNDDGSIQEYVYLNIDEQALQEHGYNANSVKLQIQSDAHAEAKKLVDEYHLKLYNEYTAKLITNEEYTTLYNGVKVVEQKWDDNEYIIGLQFGDSNIYKTYYKLLNGSTFSSNTKQVKKTFYTKTYYYGTTNYGDYTLFNRIYNYYANTVFSTISPQEAQLNYSYSVSSKRFHSDADYTTADSNGNYIHTWSVSPNEPSQQIYFYTISANRSMWIIVCIGIGLGVTLILGLVAIFIYLTNKNRNQPMNEPRQDVEY